MNFPAQMLNQQLSLACEQLCLPVTPEQTDKLIAFLQLLFKWNKAYNLTSVRDPEQMLTVHIVDSIAVSPFLTEKNYIDVGTGPGLPGIPLAIMHPEKSFTLLDSLGKRIRFIKQVAYELAITNIEPVQSRVEDFQPKAAYDGVLSRAFASVGDMLHWCDHLTDDKGAFLALKGQYPDAELSALASGYKVASTNKINVPGLDAERHLIQLIKTHTED